MTTQQPDTDEHQHRQLNTTRADDNHDTGMQQSTTAIAGVQRHDYVQETTTTEGAGKGRWPQLRSPMGATRMTTRVEGILHQSMMGLRRRRRRDIKWRLEGIGEGLDSEGGGESGMQQQACGLWISPCLQNGSSRCAAGSLHT
mgnify:CR=1 FL=1